MSFAATLLQAPTGSGKITDAVVSNNGQKVLLSTHNGYTSSVYSLDVNTGVYSLVAKDISASSSASSNVLKLAQSNDGNTVAYSHLRNGVPQIEVYNILTGEHWLASSNNSNQEAKIGVNSDFSISPDGRYVAFSSSSAELDTRDHNLAQDVYLKDLQTGKLNRISVTSTGQDATRESYTPSFSADGKSVLYRTFASNLTDDLNTSTLGALLKWDLSSKQNSTISSALDLDHAYWSPYGHVAAVNDNVVWPTGYGLVGRNGTASSVYYNQSSPYIKTPVGYNDGIYLNGVTNDGNYAFITSNKWDLIAHKAEIGSDVYRVNLQTYDIEMLTDNSNRSSSSSGVIAPSVSGDGQHMLVKTTSGPLQAMPLSMSS